MGGPHLRKLCRAEGGAKIVGVFRVKNHDFTPKNNIFSSFRGRGSRRMRPLDSPLLDLLVNIKCSTLFMVVYCIAELFNDKMKKKISHREKISKSH